MSRDGLLPAIFGAIHAQFRTPAVATWVAGFVVGIPAGCWHRHRLQSQHRHLFAFGWSRSAYSCCAIASRTATAASAPRWDRFFPVLSIVFCIVLMMGLEVITWIRFFSWLVIGLVIYFLYSAIRCEFAAATVTK